MGNAHAIEKEYCEACYKEAWEESRVRLCPRHASVDAYKEVCNQILDGTDLATLRRMARFAVDREVALSREGSQ